MRDADNIREVEKLGIDMMGFIFWEKSNRYVGAEPPAYLPVRCKRVGFSSMPSLLQWWRLQEDSSWTISSFMGQNPLAISARFVI